VKRRFRLTQSADIKRVRQFGKSYAHPLVVLVVAPSKEDRPRVAIVAGRSIGNAVIRNRAKRLIRSGLLPIMDKIQSGWDLILIARRPIVSADFHYIQTSLCLLSVKAKILEFGNNE
jgi:ribonuclease P protein component